VVRLQPPLVLSDEEANRITEVIEKALAGVSA
jgi:4-aminobutyrate aminotransferase-like enzyme